MRGLALFSAHRLSCARVSVLHQRVSACRCSARHASSTKPSSAGADNEQPSAEVRQYPSSASIKQWSISASAKLRTAELAARNGLAKAKQHTQLSLKQLSGARQTLSTILSSSHDISTRVSAAGARLNEVTGYDEIERLKQAVAAKEKDLLDAREAARTAKQAHSSALTERIESSREVNDLLSRKASWTESDVARFTALVRQDHTNEQREKDAKAAVSTADTSVETSITSLMRSILARYHEEQVWSDKIRSLSTYGSLAITAANVLIFLLALILIEPYKRKRIVREVESRMTAREAQKDVSIQAQLADLHAAFSQVTDGLLHPAPLYLQEAVEPSTSPIPDGNINHKRGDSTTNSVLQIGNGAGLDDAHLSKDISASSDTVTGDATHYTQRDLLYTSLTAAAAGCLIGGIMQTILS